MQYYYTENIDNDLLTLPVEESKHIVRVMRMKEGDELMLTDGRGTLCRACILTADFRNCEVQVTERLSHWQQRSFRLHVAVAPTKNPARMEWFAEKATEVGIDIISPVLCDHSERVYVNEERLDKIVVSAMKQSQKTYKPLVLPFTPLDQLIIDSDHAFDDLEAFIAGELPSKEESKGKKKHNSKEKPNIVNTYESANQTILKNQEENPASTPTSRPLQKFICYCNGDTRVSLREAYHKGSDVIILIGPEGDFSDNEVQLALRHGFQPITLGDTRLRTETAALAATFYLNFLNS